MDLSPLRNLAIWQLASRTDRKRSIGTVGPAGPCQPAASTAMQMLERFDETSNLEEKLHASFSESEQKKKQEMLC